MQNAKPVHVLSAYGRVVVDHKFDILYHMPTARRKTASKATRRTTKSATIQRRKTTASLSRKSATNSRLGRAKTTSSTRKRISSVQESSTGLIDVLRIVVVGITLFFIFTLTLSAVLHTLFTRSSQWKDAQRMSVLLTEKMQEGEIDRSLAILSVDVQNDQIYFIPVPDSMSIRALGKYGTFPTGSLTSLYDQEALPVSALRATIGYELGVLSTAMIELNQLDSDMKSGQLAQMLRESLLDPGRSTIGIADRYLLWRRVQFASEARFTSAPIQMTQDGELGSTQKLSQEYVSDPLVRQQQWSVAVVNTTEISGFASRIGEVLSDTGFQVINTSSADQIDLTQAKILISDQLLEDDQSIRYIQALFVDELPVIVDRDMTRRYRSDIVIILGEDLTDLYQR